MGGASSEIWLLIIILAVLIGLLAITALAGQIIKQ
jgi:hypothetical protein